MRRPKFVTVLGSQIFHSLVKKRMKEDADWDKLDPDWQGQC